MNYVFTILHILLTVYSYILIFYALMSWLPGAPDSKLGQLLAKLVSPILDPLNRWIPSLGMISFNVLIAFALISLANFALTQIQLWWF